MATCGLTGAVPSKTIRSAGVTLGGAAPSLARCTIAPTPPEFPRVLSSKSDTSSKTADQLRIRCTLAEGLSKSASSERVCRGPRPKNQVMLSVSPSGWHASQEFHAWPRRDHRPVPVTKNLRPRATVTSAPVGAAALGATEATSWVARFTADTLRDTLSIFAELVAGLKANAKAMRAAALEGYATATDLADYLVKKGLPFRDAHEAVALAVKYAEKEKRDLSELSLAELRKFAPGVGKDVFSVLTLEGSAAARDHVGGTAPARVRAAVKAARRRLVK